MKIKRSKDASLINTDVDALTTEDKFDFLKEEYKVASNSAPAYVELKDEIQKYVVKPPFDPDFTNLSEINKLYALAQSYASRVTTIEMLAIDNESRWKRIVNAMDEYIEDKKSFLLVSPELSELTIPKANAHIRVKLRKQHKRLQKLKKKFIEAESFTKIAVARKKDLAQVMTTLGRQVKALALEQQLQH